MTGDQSARYRTSLIALAREQVDDAEPVLRALVTEPPDEPDALAFLATAWYAQGRIEEALEGLERALILGPDRFVPHLKAGEMSLRLGDLDAAANQFRAGSSGRRAWLARRRSRTRPARRDAPPGQPLDRPTSRVPSLASAGVSAPAGSAD